MNIGIEELETVLTKALEDYNDEVSEILKEEIDKNAQKVRTFLKTAGEFKTRTGKYRKGFRLKRIYDSRTGARICVYNTQYRRTHVLEDGHDIKDSRGNKTGVAKAFPHWSEAEKLADELDMNVITRLT